jgi:hypothetical protein
MRESYPHRPWKVYFFMKNRATQATSSDFFCYAEIKRILFAGIHEEMAAAFLKVFGRMDTRDNDSILTAQGASLLPVQGRGAEIQVVRVVHEEPSGRESSHTRKIFYSSVAWIVPMTPGTTSNTPAWKQVGMAPAGG